MTERNTMAEKEVVEPGLDKNLERLDADLDIMERHSSELANAESDEKDAMRRWDREHKDDHLHSIPRPRKHQR